MITKEQLTELYYEKNMSMKDISLLLDCSVNKVAYWMKKHNLKTRSISDAIYTKNNSTGDPFLFNPPKTAYEHFVYGIGLGLYWGEGTKSNKHSVRLGNTDPDLILVFIQFLVVIYQVDIERLRFGLQIFSDIDTEEALNFWSKKLNVSKEQFYKPTITHSGSIGTYRQKSRYGVMTIYFNNKKLRDSIIEQLADIAQLVERDHGKIEVTGSNPVIGSM